MLNVRSVSKNSHGPAFRSPNKMINDCWIYIIIIIILLLYIIICIIIVVIRTPDDFNARCYKYRITSKTDKAITVNMIILYIQCDS